MNKVYLSYPITGYDIKERREFANSTIQKLKSEHEDWDIVNPLELAGEVYRRTTNPTYEDFMEYDLSVLRTCDMTAFCKGWQASNGCKREMEFCRRHGIEVVFL